MLKIKMLINKWEIVLNYKLGHVCVLGFNVLIFTPPRLQTHASHMRILVHYQLLIHTLAMLFSCCIKFIFSLHSFFNSIF